MKLLVAEAVTKQRLWELWRGDWPRWNELSFYAPMLLGSDIEWDGKSFLRRIEREFPVAAYPLAAIKVAIGVTNSSILAGSWLAGA